MYTSTTICSLCIVELQHRHSELVNGAVTSNMSYLTKKKKNCHTVIGCVSCRIKKEKRKILRQRFSCFLSYFPSEPLWKLQETAAALK